MASRITSVSSACSTVCSGADQRKHQNAASLAFVRGNSPVTGEFPAQKASKAKNVSISWRHHDNPSYIEIPAIQSMAHNLMGYGALIQYNPYVYRPGKFLPKHTQLPHFAVTAFTNYIYSWWRHQMETFSALLAICAGNSPGTGEFPAQRPVTRSFDVYFDLRPNKRLSKQSLGWWFETLSPPLWRHRNVNPHVMKPSDILDHPEKCCF